MDTEFIWMIVGVILILLEFIMPGLVVIFLGMGAILVGVLQWIGLLESWWPSFTVWCVSSLVFLLFLRGLGQRLLPGEKECNYSDEDEDAFGAVVEVIEAVGADHEQGRIKFRGTTWSATSMDADIPAGSKARIICRQDIRWIVEPYDTIECGEISHDDNKKDID